MSSIAFFFFFSKAKLTSRASQKAHHDVVVYVGGKGGQRGGHGRFSWLNSALLIAADLWKLGNRAAERLLASPAFPHSHFQRFLRVQSADWW